MHPTHLPRLRDRNQPDGLIVNQRDALIVISTLPLRCALTECRVRDLESTSRVQHCDLVAGFEMESVSSLHS